MATNDEIIAKLPLALVELRKQNKDAATKAAEDRAKEFEVLMSSRDAAAVGSVERKAMNSELAKMRNQDSRLAARAKEAAASTAGQAVALKEELEKNGKIAEDNKEFQKLSYEARKEDYAQRLKDATSPAAKKQIREDARNDAKKNGSRLDKIAAGIGGLFEMGKKGLKAAKLGGLAILSTLAIGAFVIALGKFLQSDTFKKMTKFIEEEILPKLVFIKDNWETIAILIGSFLASLVIFKAIVVAGKLAAIITEAGGLFALIKTGMMTGLVAPLQAGLVALAPIILVAVLIATVLYALWQAFKDFNKTLEETGSIGEAIKSALTTFFSTLVGIIPALFLKLVAFVADMFGFEEFAKKIGDIDPIAWIAKSIEGLISDVVDFFKMLFDFDFAGFAKSLVPNWAKKILGISGSEQTPEQMTQERVKELESKKEDLSNKRSNPENRAEIAKYDAEIEALKLSAAEGPAKKRSVLTPDYTAADPYAHMKPSAARRARKKDNMRAREAEKLKPSQYKESASIVENMEKSKQQAELARQQQSTAAPTNIVDARQSSSVTTTGQSGNSPVVNPRYGNLNRGMM